MSLAQVARELMAAGITGDALCDALERIEQASKERTRSKGAERQARYRERQKASQVTGDASQVSAPPSPSSSPPITPLITTPSTPPSNVSSAREADFDALRSAYPRRAGSDPRKPAFEKFQIAVRRGHSPAAMIAGARAYAAYMAGTEPRFVKQLAVWLNQECWTEDWANKPRDGPRAQSGSDFLAQLVLGNGYGHEQPSSEPTLIDITPGAP